MSHRWGWWVVLATLAACRPGPAAGPTPDGSVCLVAAPSDRPLDTVSVSFIGHPDSGTVARFVARHLQTPLLRRDCARGLQPGLAQSWTRLDEGRTWLFALDTTLARWSDRARGEEVELAFEEIRNGGLWPWSRILEIRSQGPATLLLRLDSAFADVPEPLAHPALAVPLGPYRQLLRAQPSTGPLLDLRLLGPAEPGTRHPLTRVQTFRRGLDPRDLLDLPAVGPIRPADLVLTRDHRLIEYARSRQEFRVVPLAWDVTYLLVEGDSAAPVPEFDPRAFRGEIRRAVPPAWLNQHCPAQAASLPGPVSRQVAYAVHDSLARQIAERLVAVRYPGHRVIGLAPADLATAASQGRHAAYVIAAEPGAGLGCPLPAMPAARVVPLFDSRPSAIVRDGVPPFTIEEDGLVRFLPYR